MTKGTKIKKLHSIPILLAFNGYILSVVYMVYNFTDTTWFNLYDISKDSQIFGLCWLAFLVCSYKHLFLKIMLFILCPIKLSVLISNAIYLNKGVPASITLIVLCIYTFWALRASFAREIKDLQPAKDEAYFILLPIHSLLGLLKAILIPWHPAFYETTMVCDSNHIWSVHHNRFCKTPVSETDISEIESIRIPFGKSLSPESRSILDSMVGEKAIRGIKDCRRYLNIKQRN